MGTHCGRAGERTQRATLSRPERLREKFGPCAIISTSECCAELGRRASDGEPAFPRSLKSKRVGSRIARGGSPILTLSGSLLQMQLLQSLRYCAKRVGSAVANDRSFRIFIILRGFRSLPIRWATIQELLALLWEASNGWKLPI